MKGLHHIEIYTSDLNRSIIFWDWLLKELGYTDHQRWESGKSWKVEDTYIVFVQTEQNHLSVPYHRKRTGLNHLAFHVESPAKLAQFKEELAKRGICLLYPEKKLRPNVLYFEDPDRIKVELVVP